MNTPHNGFADRKASDTQIDQHSHVEALATTFQRPLPPAENLDEAKRGSPWVPIIVIAVILGLGIGVYFWMNRPVPAAMAPSAPPAAPVTVAAAIERSVTEWDNFSGRIRAIDRVEIRPRVGGMIEAVHFTEGQLVKQGDRLFTIDPRPFEADLARSKADLASAQARLALAKTQQERYNHLIHDRVISQDELDQQNAAVLDAQAKVQAAEAGTVSTELNLGYTSIVAPIAGRVSRAEVTAGNLVGAGITAPVLTTIVSVSPVYAEFDIDESSFVRYSAKGITGNTGVEKIPVSMGLANEDGYPHEGHLKSIDNQLDTTSGTVRVRAVFDNPDGLLAPGLFARIRTGGAASEAVVLIDDKAVGTDQDKKFVMVVDADNKAGYRAVILGPIVDGLRIVRSGLQKGERIVVNGLQRVRPNSVVKPNEVSMEAPPSASSSR